MLKFLYTLIFIIILIGALMFTLLWFQRDSDGPELVFNGPEEIWLGVPFDLEVSVSNNSDQIFQDAKIALSLPEGVVLVGAAPDETLVSRKIGNLGAGGLTSETFKLMVVATESPRIDIQETVTASIDYSPEFLGSRFKKELPWNFTVAGPAVELTVTPPEKIISGESLDFTVSYKNISNSDLNDLVLAVEYPPTFQYEKATIEPEENNNQWLLGSLRVGSKNNFLITGKLIGPENSFFNFKFKLQSQLEDQLYLIGYLPLDLTIGVAPLDMKIIVNDADDYVAKLNDNLKYQINYRFLNPPANGEATVTAKLTGVMFDFGSINVGPPVGKFNKETSAIIWQLDDLEQSGSVGFTINTKNDFDIKRLGDRNFVLGVEVTMDNGRLTAAARSENKLSGKVVVDAQAFFRDAASGVVNEGPFPPTVGQATDYTIHWLVTNYATDIKNLVIKAKLPAGVSFTGFNSSNGATKPEYSAETNEMIWTIDRVSATKGMIGVPLEAAFQIRATPAVEVAGNYMLLLEKTRATATDEFTGFALSHTDDQLTTQLPDDKTVSNGKVTASTP